MKELKKHLQLFAFLASIVVSFPLYPQAWSYGASDGVVTISYRVTAETNSSCSKAWLLITNHSLFNLHVSYRIEFDDGSHATGTRRVPSRGELRGEREGLYYPGKRCNDASVSSITITERRQAD